MSFKVFACLFALVCKSVAQSGAAYCTYHMYEKNTLLTTLSCSDGQNGLISWAGNDISGLFPYVTAWEGVKWNSPQCGTCMKISNKGKQVFVTVVDQCGKSEKPGTNHFDMSPQSFFQLFGQEGVDKGTMEGNFEVVSPSSCKGNKKAGGAPITPKAETTNPTPNTVQTQKNIEPNKNVPTAPNTLSSAATIQKSQNDRIIIAKPAEIQQNSEPVKNVPSAPNALSSVSTIQKHQNDPIVTLKPAQTQKSPLSSTSSSSQKADNQFASSTNILQIANQGSVILIKPQNAVLYGIPIVSYNMKSKKVHVDQTNDQSTSSPVSQQIPIKLIQIAKTVFYKKKQENLKSCN